jgi:hypothetical protein
VSDLNVGLAQGRTPMTASEALKLPAPIEPPPPIGEFREVHGPKALDEIPASRAAIADVIANWSAADANIRILLISCFGKNLEAASNLIDRAQADNFIHVLLPAAISLQGRSDMVTASKCFLAAREIVKGFRDTLAHGVFAVRSDLPRRILVANGNSYRKDHVKLFQRLRDDPFQSLHEIQFKVWSEEDFLRARIIACGLLNSSHAMSVCLARDSHEVERWRSALEKRGLLLTPPHEV